MPRLLIGRLDANNVRSREIGIGKVRFASQAPTRLRLEEEGEGVADLWA